MSTYLAFLRGINVGGKNMLPMPKLKQLFEAAGCTHVSTYIQSGNVIFSAPSIQGLAKRIVAQIEKDLALKTPIVLRSLKELKKIAQQNPFLQGPDPSDPNLLHVMFLDDTPTADQIAKLDPDRSPPDRFIVQGPNIYLCLLGGVANTKLSNAYFDSKLSTISTGRNWRTVNKLVELAEAVE